MAHTALDTVGSTVGYGGNSELGYAFGSEEYGPGSATIDTMQPIQVSASFPYDAGSGLVTGIDMTLSQEGRTLSFSLDAASYGDGFVELTEALEAGMTPVVSYWTSTDMNWLVSTPKQNKPSSCRFCFG